MCQLGNSFFQGIMFTSILFAASLSTITATVATKDKPQPPVSNIEHILRLINNFDLKCFREMNSEEDSSFTEYMACGKDNNVQFQAKMSGMIRSVFIFDYFKAQGLTCVQPSCSIQKSWDGTGVCERLNKKKLISRIKISYTSSSSRYSKIIYGIEDRMYTPTRLLTLELEPGAGSCGHVVTRPGKHMATVYDTLKRTTCGLTVGQCIRWNTDKSCIFICMCASQPPLRKRICQTRSIEEPEFDEEYTRSEHNFYTLFHGSDSILSISLDKNGRLFVLTSSTHRLVVKSYKHTGYKWKFLKEEPISRGTLSLSYSNINSKILMMKKKSIDIQPISKTIRKEETDLVCWCHNVNKVVIVNRLFPFVRRIVSIP